MATAITSYTKIAFNALFGSPDVNDFIRPTYGLSNPDVSLNQPLIGNTFTGALSPENTGGGFHTLCDPLFGVLGDELGHLHVYVGGQNRKVVTSTRNDLFTVFAGSSGPGGCTLNGANVGDIVRGVIQLTSSPTDKASSFESTISVTNQIRQVSSSDLSSQTFIVEVRRQS